MSWIFLTIAGSLEVGFTTFMKLASQGGRPWAWAGFGVCAVMSFYFLTRATATIPLGTAYAVWTGIGAFGTALVGILVFGDPSSWVRIGLLALLIGSIIGLKVVSN